MFTGIIETRGRVIGLERQAGNLDLWIESPLCPELKIDQSLAHDGVCLTVVELKPEKSAHRVTAVAETLEKTHLNQIQLGDYLNLERAMQLGARLDGHIVQGHIDFTAKCVERAEREGSWHFSFQYPPHEDYRLVSKGSICINGVSLTVVNPSDEGHFSVAIIPYTFEHTGFKDLQVGQAVSLEFDVLGKYVARYLKHFQSS